MVLGCLRHQPCGSAGRRPAGSGGAGRAARARRERRGRAGCRAIKRAAGARGARGQFALLLRVAPVVRVPGAPWQPRVYTWCTCLATARTAPGVAGQAAARDLFSSMPLQILQCDEVCAQQDADAQQPARRLLANRVRNSSAHTRCRVCGVRAHRMPRCTRTGTSCIDMRRMTSITATPAAVAVAPHAAASGWCSTLSR